MSDRIIVVGDIHGCLHEFAELLERVAWRPGDRLVLLGDLINRGPDSPGVVDLALAHHAISVLGNHEARLLAYRRSRDPDLLKDDDAQTFAALRPEHWAYLEKMPLTYEEPTYNLVCVHGGFLPNEAWRRQPASTVTRIQVIDAEGRPRKRAECPEGRLWADCWSGPPFVLYGHTPRPDIYRLKWSAGLDTACVLGGHLTAYLLPERRFVQVKARRRYWT
jgi:serine/threonine protein phosphatase 1